MFRVVMISPLPPQRAGESSYSARLIENLANLPNVSVVAITGRQADTLADHGGRVKTLAVWNCGDIRYPIKLIGAIKHERPHIVHVQFGPDHRVYGGLFGEIMLALLILLRVFGIKTTVTLHSTWLLEEIRAKIATYRRLGSLAILGPVFFRLYMRFLDLGTDSIQLSTPKTQSTLLRMFLKEYRFNPRKIFEIPHPCGDIVNTGKSHLAPLKNTFANRKVILIFGFIRRGKGIEVALRAMKYPTLPSDALLLVAGRPLDLAGKRYLDELRSIVAEEQLSEKVVFYTRFIPEEDVPRYFAAASAVLVPYSESVGASGPAHNFAGYGIPIVGADVGYHMKESLGGNLVLFRAGDSEDLAAKLGTVLTDNRFASDISARLVKYAREETWALATKRTLAYYLQTIKNRNHRHTVS